MVSWYTFEMSRAMANPVCRERALMSDLVKPMDGPNAQTTELIASVILSPMILCHYLV